MRYFNGFMFSNEETLFEEYLSNGDFTIAGFSYGAIKAFEKTEELILEGARVDKLQLFSPAFFQNRGKSFIKMQLIYFKKDPPFYRKNFYQNAFYPADIDSRVKKSNGKDEELEELLTYVWDRDRVKKLSDSGVEIEIYLGEQDKIIDLEKAYNFFKELGEVCLIKEAGHTLLSK